MGGMELGVVSMRIRVSAPRCQTLMRHGIYFFFILIRGVETYWHWRWIKEIWMIEFKGKLDGNWGVGERIGVRLW